MEIIEATKKDFNNIIGNSFFRYGIGDFNDLNKSKCDSEYYFLFKEGKFRLGLTGGIVNGCFLSPYSAPFGSFSFVRKDIKSEYIDSAIDLLIEWSKTKNLDAVQLTLPPSIYNDSFISKQVNSLFRKNFELQNIELNHSFITSNFTDNYITFIKDNARRNLKHALGSNLKFHICTSVEDKKIVYDIIKQHKAAKGYPLKLTWKEIEDTSTLIKSDFFLVYNSDETPIASAIYFHSGNSIAQLIYWGDQLEFHNLRTMNFLSYKIFEYYKSKDFNVVDLGPSTENSVPNAGLCDFKESLGCTTFTKFSFRINLL